ncbi:uncharacterized protein LOC126637171 isoform X10 [Myiozetetes cayanensis]|uniref:uncharacterized protein LOC126637171 isoform X10 n=2 Tax=Myiozetetes cayanensis TaxID=478635 RepID=UPI002160206E|nr:uncharacterized protein LOC126637171 isoform X10 [Myiozetetes cayanensis]
MLFLFCSPSGTNPLGKLEGGAVRKSRLRKPGPSNAAGALFSGIMREQSSRKATPCGPSSNCHFGEEFPIPRRAQPIPGSALGRLGWGRMGLEDAWQPQSWEKCGKRRREPHPGGGNPWSGGVIRHVEVTACPGDTIPWRTHGHGTPDAQWGHPIPGHKSMEDMVPSHPTWDTPSQDTNPWRTWCHPTPPGTPHPRTQIHGGHGAIPPQGGHPIPGHKSMEDMVPSHPTWETPSQDTNPWRTRCHPTPPGTPHPRTQIRGGHGAIPPQGGHPIPGNSSSLKDRPCPWCHQGTGDVSPHGHSTRVPGNVPSLGTQFPGGHTAMASLMPSGDTPSQDTNPWRTWCHPTPPGKPHPRTQIHGGHDAIPPHLGNPIPGHKSMEDMVPSHPTWETPSQDTNPWRTRCHPTPMGTPHPRAQIHGGHGAIPPQWGHPIPGHKSMEDMMPSHPKGETPFQGIPVP